MKQGRSQYLFIFLPSLLQENLGLPKSLPPTGGPSRAPLLTLRTNEQERTTEPCIHQNTATPTLSDLRPCPKCTSPSQTQHGQCQCLKCGLLFCSKCLRQTDSHDTIECLGLPVLRGQTEKKLRTRKSNREIVGSKKSRDRIRRL